MTLSMYERIAAGEFKTKLIFPTKPKRPAVLNKKVSEVTDEEFASLTETVKAYDAALEQYDAEYKAYTQDQSRLYQLFETEALKDVGLAGHEAERRAWDYAYEQGHSSGCSEIYNHLQEIAYVVLGK